MKKHRLIVASIVFALALIGTLYTSCEHESDVQDTEGGTGVGNPMAPVATKLVSSACALIHRCHPQVSTTACSSAMIDASGIDYQIGLPTGFYATFDSVIRAEIAGTLVAHHPSADACAKFVAGLSCESPEVRGAFTSATSDPYWGLPRLFLHDLCGQVLQSSGPTATGRFHYVRAAAQGRGDGSDWENACPGFTGVCSGENLRRGDTYYVASGDYRGVTFSASGTELITIKKATREDHGTATGWLDSYAVGPAAFSWWVFQSSHWVIDGKERSSLTSGHGFQIDSPRLNLNCATNFCNAILLASDKAIDRVTLRYVEVIGYGVDSRRHLNGLYSVPDRGSSSNILLYGVLMRDFGMYNGNSPVKTAGLGVLNLTIDNSAFVRSAARVFADAGSENVTVRNSWFQDVSDQGIIISYNMGSALTSKNWSIFGNTFWQSDPATFGIQDGAIQCTNRNICVDWRIANNTFANFTTARTGSSGVNFFDSGVGTSGIQILNNIWFNSSRVDPLGPVSHDYNLYVLSSNAPTEAHGQIDGIDPFQNSGSGDFQLRVPTFPGLPLPAPLHIDREGKFRGSDGVWDAGALEF